jgi:hypothetical protein
MDDAIDRIDMLEEERGHLMQAHELIVQAVHRTSE